MYTSKRAQEVHDKLESALRSDKVELLSNITLEKFDLEGEIDSIVHTENMKPVDLADAIKKIKSDNTRIVLRAVYHEFRKGTTPDARLLIKDMEKLYEGKDLDDVVDNCLKMMHKLSLIKFRGYENDQPD